MIARLGRMLRPEQRDDFEAGFTVIEVMVAMMVFAIMSVGIAYGIANALQATQATRGRATAVALAGQDIDGLRQLAAQTTNGIFNVVENTGFQKRVGGVTYTIARAVNWVQSDGATGACGTSNGKLAYKSVAETVSWANPHGGGKLSTTTTSAIAPASAVTDPGYGTIIVSVTDASGAPNQGVSVTVTPISGSGAASLTAQPASTDSQGCTYATNVQPGDYVVSASEAGGIDTAQAQPSVQKPITVTAGASSPVPYSYDLASTISLRYAPTQGATLPANMPTVLSSTAGGLDTMTPWDTTSQTVAKSSSDTLSMPAFPFTSGYTAVAGPYSNASGSASCLSPNPGSWTTANTSGAYGAAPTTISVSPGSDATPKPAAVLMGVASVKLDSKQPYIVAVSSSNTPVGDPGCQTGMTMNFAASSSGNPVIALPFGTWKLYSSNTFGTTSGTNVRSTDLIASNASNVTLKTPGSVNQSKLLGIITYDNTVTFDPRGQKS